MISRREFFKLSGAVGAGLLLSQLPFRRSASAQIPGGTLDPDSIPKFVTQLIVPPAMPGKFNNMKDKYRIAVRQFLQQILPSAFPQTTVWSYGSVDYPSTFNYPAYTIEAHWNRTTQVQWRNELVDAQGNYLPHILPVDQTLHWANPPGGIAGRDTMGVDPAPYAGPVPMVTHVHGAHVAEQSDGYAEAWYLPAAANIPAGYATTGTFYDYFNMKYGEGWGPGEATFKYSNDQRATTLWYHDHSLGMTRVNVYAGPAGFWLIRGGPDDLNLGYYAPGVGDDPFGKYTEIPIVIQDRSFNADGSLFYPDNRAFFEGLDVGQLQIPFIPDPACNGHPSDIAPIWNPEFFGNTMVVNGRTWPYLEVEQRRYRFRLLNGCNSRFLILKFDRDTLPVVQIGAEGGFLAAPVNHTGGGILMAPAERADVVVDFTGVPTGTEITLLNIGPDEPFGGGVPGLDFPVADPLTTGQVMQFRVVSSSGSDNTTPPMDLSLPGIAALVPDGATQYVTLNEEESESVFVREDFAGNLVLACDDPSAEPFAPKAALLGTIADGALKWMDPITENPMVGETQIWEIHNYTVDAHPIHVHQVMFQVLGREVPGGGTSLAGSNAALPSENGWKDTVIAYPGEITRIQARFDLPGYYVWHCHIVEHEDNEMMRPFHVGPIPPMP